MIDDSFWIILENHLITTHLIIEIPRAGAADPQGDQQVPRREACLEDGGGGRRGGTRGRAVQGGQVAGVVLRQLRQLKKSVAGDFLSLPQPTFTSWVCKC